VISPLLANIYLHFTAVRLTKVGVPLTDCFQT
jgi:hypothetical protein